MMLLWFSMQQISLLVLSTALCLYIAVFPFPSDDWWRDDVEMRSACISRSSLFGPKPDRSYV